MSATNTAIATMLQEAVDTINVVAQLYLENTDDNNLIITKLQQEIQIAQEIINNFLSGPVDGGDIDRLAELVAAITLNKDHIAEIIVSDALKTQVQDTLTSQATKDALSARQGYLLKQMIDASNTLIAALQTVSHSHNNTTVLTELKDKDTYLQYKGRALGMQPTLILTKAEADALTSWPAQLDANGIILIQE